MALPLALTWAGATQLGTAILPPNPWHKGLLGAPAGVSRRQRYSICLVLSGVYTIKSVFVQIL
jgi:hypothetical protein